ncbi:uncharacterized protein LOC118804943 [Colossoma macropomum]|uniref:uncharacterized protein LOC118804943 n=1 Tax=Colossoma macropomum TaxID=42526 RepID=UPI00186497FD|nr:uncharacterized protein LOC118804943 [Colossoma macropomum]
MFMLRLMLFIFSKMLHSILFLGNINAAPYYPDDIFAEKEIYLKTMKDFPQSFDKYREDVALRTPFSYFLELIVRCFGENKEQVKAKLCEKLQGCKKSGPLISSVICIRQVSNRTYYGGSLTCPGEIEREIMTAVSCLHVWHPYVSAAVLGVFPEDTTEPRFPDGTIRLPASVECRAYDIENLSVVKPPCRRCHELYSLPNPRGRRHYPGNCAETEAISTLLKNEERVKKNVKKAMKSAERQANNNDFFFLQYKTDVQ